MRRLAKNGGRGGFTLVELIVVLVIMGIMAAMIIPQMQGSYEDALLRSSGRKIISVLNLTYAQAVSHNQPHRLRLDSHTGKYFVEKRVRGLTQNDGFAAVKDLAGGEGTIDPRISLELRRTVEETVDENALAGAQSSAAGPAENIGFFADGTADGTEILLKDRAGFKLVLQVSAVTGRVQIVDPDPGKQP
jgi:type II secretion system protein H